MLEQLSQTYRGKKIFLTGHTGFKGAWLLKILKLIGADVKGYALSPKTDSDLYYLIGGDGICHSVIDDLRNRERLLKEIIEFEPDFIFHLAAQPLVRESYSIPSETFEINAIGTANVLDGLNQLKKRCSAIMITTDKVYYNNEWAYPYRENDRLGGYDPYSASKACTELVIDSYRNSFFNINCFDKHLKSVGVARAGNVIGGGDWSADRLIPDIAKAFGNNDKVQIRNPNAVRPWQHVLEPLLGYLILGQKLWLDPIRFSQPYNFGPHAQDSLSVKEMMGISIDKWGEGHYNVVGSDNEPHEAGLLKLDISKSMMELNWQPKLNAYQAVEWTMDWYKSYFKGEDMNEYTSKQISKYIDLTLRRDAI